MNSQADQFPNISEITPLPASDDPSASTSKDIPATRARLRMKQSFRQNRFVVIGAGALVVAFLLFVAVSVPRSRVSQPAKSQLGTPFIKVPRDDVPAEGHSLLPITNAGQPTQKLTEDGGVNEEAVERTATHLSTVRPARPSPAIRKETLASIPPFPESWQPPPYSQRSELNQEASEKAEKDGLQKSSFAYVRNISASNTNISAKTMPVSLAPEQFIASVKRTHGSTLHGRDLQR